MVDALNAQAFSALSASPRARTLYDEDTAWSHDQQTQQAARLDPLRVRSWGYRKPQMGEAPVVGSTGRFL